MFTTGVAMAHSAAGRYEQAAQWADRSLREQPGCWPSSSTSSSWPWPLTSSLGCF